MVDSEKIREQLPAIFLKLCEVEVYRSGESFHRVFEKKDGDISTTAATATATATVAVTDSGGEGGEADTSESNNTINEAPQSIDIFFWAHVPASFRLLALQDKSIGTQHISATSSHHFIIQTRKEKILNIPIHPESARRRMSRTIPRGPIRRRYVLCQQVDSVEEWQTALQVLEYGCLLAMSKTEAKDVLEVVSFVCLVSAHPYAETELYEHIFSSSTLPEVQRLVQAGGFLFLYHDGSSDAFESLRSTEELSVTDKGGELDKTTSKEESNDQEGTEQPGSTGLSTEEGEVKQEKKRKNPGQKARARAKALALAKEKPVVAPPQVVASTANTVLVSTQSHFPDKALQNKVVELSTAVGNMRKDIQAVRKQMVNLENVVKHLCQAVEKLLPAAQQDSSLAPADLVSTVPSEEEVGTEEIVVKEEEEEEEAKEEEMAVSSSSVEQEEVVAQVESGTDVPSTD
eukprot:scaffold2602_cov177-Ochromonas_danica.AAC.9